MKGGWVWKNKFYRYFARTFNIVSLTKFLFGEKITSLIKSKVLSFTTDKVNKLDEEIKIKLYKKYKSDIENLSKLLNRDLKKWKYESS